MMPRVFALLIYLGIGCAYQASYADLTLAQIATADVPLSLFGHVLAWPAIMLWHAIGIIGWILLVVFLMSWALVIWLCWDELVAWMYRKGKPQ